MCCCTGCHLALVVRPYIMRFAINANDPESDGVTMPLLYEGYGVNVQLLHRRGAMPRLVVHYLIGAIRIFEHEVHNAVEGNAVDGERQLPLDSKYLNILGKRLTQEPECLSETGLACLRTPAQIEGGPGYEFVISQLWHPHTYVLCQSPFNHPMELFSPAGPVEVAAPLFPLVQIYQPESPRARCVGIDSRVGHIFSRKQSLADANGVGGITVRWGSPELPELGTNGRLGEPSSGGRGR